MLFIFALFIVGWGPINFLAIVNAYSQLDRTIMSLAVLLSELASLSIILDLFWYNEQLSNYIRNKLRPC